MSHTNDCAYCKSKFKYKFPYRTWQKVTKFLYSKVIKRFSRIETITFIYNKKSWILADNEKVPHEIDECLNILLVEPMTRKEAGKKTSFDDYWPDVNSIEDIPADRDIDLLKRINKKDSKLDMNIIVYDFFDSDREHYCGIVSIKGNENIQIILEEAWNRKL